MVSYLSTSPQSVLHVIAFFCFTSSTIGPPQVLPLLLTCSAIYKALRVEACPVLYERLFKFYFDYAFVHQRPRGNLLASSACVAAELVHRFNVLRRIRLLEFSDQYIGVDLWTVYLMVLESDDQNDAQMAAVGINRFLFEFIRTRFRHEFVTYGSPLRNNVNSLALWLACLTTSSCECLMPLQTLLDLTFLAAVLANESAQSRDELYELLCPLAMAPANVNDFHSPGRPDLFFSASALEVESTAKLKALARLRISPRLSRCPALAYLPRRYSWSFVSRIRHRSRCLPIFFRREPSLMLATIGRL
jgi:hypothetical protein